MVARTTKRMSPIRSVVLGTTEQKLYFYLYRNVVFLSIEAIAYVLPCTNNGRKHIPTKKELEKIYISNIKKISNRNLFQFTTNCK